MKFTVNLPPINIAGPRAAPEAIAKLVVARLLPSLGAQLVPHLPPPAPARRAVSLRELDKTGRVPSHASTAKIPAVPPRAVQAAEIATSMVPAMVGQYAKAIREQYAALDAAQARARAAAQAADIAPVKRRIQAAATRAAKALGGTTSSIGDPEPPTTKGRTR